MKTYKVLKKLSQPCFGFYLEGGVKSLAVVDVGIEIAMLIIQTVATVDPAFLQAWYNKRDEDLIKFYARPIHWIYYYAYFIISLCTSFFLHDYAARRDKLLVRRILISYILLFVPWLVFFLSHTFWLGFENKRGLATFVGFTLYKVYSFWIINSYLWELEFYGDLNSDMRRLTDKEVETFFEGMPKVSWYPNDEHPFKNLPHKKEFEIPRGHFVLDYEKPLGSGAFGVVLRGHMKRRGDPFVPEGTHVDVAVKTVDPNADISLFKALLSEMKVLSYIGRHENIVNFVGACTSGIKDRQLFVIVELCPLGSVLNYVKSNRGVFEHDGYYLAANMQRALTKADLLKWAYQTASGMEFIASQNVIHGDLAARNILLTVEKDAKIADFGLSRQLYHYMAYTKRNNDPLPWRWMPPESLCDLTFSTKSDVWSFGVTIWEYFSLGETPFAGYSYGVEFVKALTSEDPQVRLRLECPAHASREIYEKMQQCWDPNPEFRPTFHQLKYFFGNLLQVQKLNASASSPSSLSYFTPVDN